MVVPRVSFATAVSVIESPTNAVAFGAENATDVTSTFARNVTVETPFGTDTTICCCAITGDSVQFVVAAPFASVVLVGLDTVPFDGATPHVTTIPGIGVPAEFVTFTAGGKPRITPAAPP